MHREAAWDHRENDQCNGDGSIMTLMLTETMSDGEVLDCNSMLDVCWRGLECADAAPADGRFYAEVPVDDRHEIYGLNSSAFRDWLIIRCLAERGAAPSGSVVGRVLALLETKARCEGTMPGLHVRVGRESAAGGAEFYVDLANASGQAAKISAGDWVVVDQAPARFRRPAGLLPLPNPVRGGSIERLRPYVNLTEPDFRLLIGWMAAALRPEGPYPILAIHGEQGSAKSTLAKIIRKLIDPQQSPVLAVPGGVRDLIVSAVNGWLLAYDNISTVRDWLSDGLCRLATGGGFAGRALFHGR